jgi:hypothetical protein
MAHYQKYIRKNRRMPQRKLPSQRQERDPFVSESTYRPSIQYIKGTMDPRNGNISQYRPNWIDKISDKLPDTGPTGLLKGIYGGLDSGLFLGLLPNPKHPSTSKEISLGEKMGMIYSPYAVKGTAKSAVSGVKVGKQIYPTPLGYLLANSIRPYNYEPKMGEVLKTLRSKKRLKATLIDDEPQYVLDSVGFPRLYAWRRRFGLPAVPRGKTFKSLYQKRGMGVDPVKDFKQNYEMKNMGNLGDVLSLRNLDNPHGRQLLRSVKNLRSNPRLWGSHLDMDPVMANYTLQKIPVTTTGGNKATGFRYFDRWDFAHNNKPESLKHLSEIGKLLNPFKKGYNTHYDSVMDKMIRTPRTYKEDLKKIPHYIDKLRFDIPTDIQRAVGNALTRDVTFMGDVIMPNYVKKGKFPFTSRAAKTMLDRNYMRRFDIKPGTDLSTIRGKHLKAKGKVKQYPLSKKQRKLLELIIRQDQPIYVGRPNFGKSAYGGSMFRYIK